MSQALDPYVQNTTATIRNEFRVAGLYTGAYTGDMPYAWGTDTKATPETPRPCHSEHCVLGEPYSTLPYTATVDAACVKASDDCHSKGMHVPNLYNISTITIDVG